MTQLDPQKHGTPLKFFLATNKKEIKWVVLNSLLYSSGAIAVTGISYFLSKIIDMLNSGGGNVRLFVIAFFVVLVGNELLYRIGHVLEVSVSARIRRSAKENLLNYLSRLSFGYFADRFAGQISHQIGTVADGMERLKNIFTNDFVDVVAITLISFVTLTFVYYPLGIVVAIWIPLFSLGLRPFIRKITISSEAFAEQSSHTSGIMVDTYTNIAVVKVYSKSSDQEKIYKQIRSEYGSHLFVGRWEVGAYAYQGISGIVLLCALFCVTAYGYVHGAVTIGQLFLISAVSLRILDNLYHIGHNISNYIRTKGEVSQALKDLLVPITVMDGVRTADASWSEIRVGYNDVTFSYNKNKKVLDRFNLVIPPGQKIGVVGLSGAGKTTLVNLLLRFFDPQQGSISINSVDISTMNQESLRSCISFISQDTSLFHSTVAENISYGSSHVTMDDIKNAAIMAYADEFIALLPDGYNTVVGERGVKLSGGQRQRIAIARAMLKNSQLFLLDEATSALDSDSEAKVQEALKTLMDGKTVIAIAHRLSTLQFMDRIIFIDNGKIVEDGTHAELLERNGKYAELWNMQSGGFIVDQSV